MWGFIQQHRLSEQVDKLKERSEDAEQWSNVDITKWEVLDLMIAQGQRAAEKQCPAKRSGQYPWSLEFEKARKKWLYWHLRTQEIMAKYTNQELLHELAKSVNDRQWLDSKTIFSKCREPKRQLTRVKKEAATLREQHLQDMAKLAALLHNMSEKATRLAIAWREKTTRQFNEAHPLLNGVQSMGMDRLEVLDSFAVLREKEPHPRIPLVLKEEMEEVLLPHMEKWFRQHQETPFGQGDRRNSLGY
jgi:hypothetical protein